MYQKDEKESCMAILETEYEVSSNATKTGNSKVCGLFAKRTNSKDYLPSWKRRFGLFSFAMLQNGLLGGLVFGWASIDQTLLSAPIENGGAGLYLNDSSLIFSWAAGVAMLAPFIMGVVLDNHGPRICSIMSCLIIACGCLIFAYSSEDFLSLAVGACLIGFGGPGIASAIIHISNLFPGNENLAMATVAGVVAFSFAVFAIFDVLWTNFNATLQSLFVSLSMIALALAVGAFLFYSDEPYEEFREIEDDGIAAADSSKTVLHLSETIRLIDDDHSHHIHCISSASIHIEQPLDSYLRDERKFLNKTESFFAAKKVLSKRNHSELAAAVSLKDQPFSKQVSSTIYLRATLVFVVTSFVTNFYVASISTELADLQEYDSNVQHELSRSFTVIMSMGAFVSIFVGWLIDQIGVEACMAITLVLGQAQMVMVLLFRKNRGLFIASFWMYTFFRQFLYPAYIATLTSRLGFKYFGVLLGIGFGISGFAQLCLPMLDETVRGDCHLSLLDTSKSTIAMNEECNPGKWWELHVVQIILLGALFIVPFQNHQDRILQEIKIRKVLSSEQSSRSGDTRYGTEST